MILLTIPSDVVFLQRTFPRRAPKGTPPKGYVRISAQRRHNFQNLKAPILERFFVFVFRGGGDQYLHSFPYFGNNASGKSLSRNWERFQILLLFGYVFTPTFDINNNSNTVESVVVQQSFCR